MSCPGCGSTAPVGAKFCADCGTPLAAAGPPPQEERRVVTIVFCDLVGSTAMSTVLDPEVLRSVTLRYFELMRTSLQAHGGTVEKFIGDAVMAVFGVPVMHEDDARRALAATLDMTAALAQFNLELQVSLGIQLQVRIGVNTGEVIATPDPSAGQALVSGEVVNAAARLEQHAEAGQILIGEQTVQAAGPAAVVESRGPMQFKGLSAAMVGYQLLDLLADDPEVLRRFDVPFVGREQERAELDLLLDRAGRQRSCQLVNVYGEAGIGKTRLVRTWQGELGSALVGSGRCRPYGEAGTLIALADATEQLLATAWSSIDRDGAEDLAEARAILDCGLLKDGAPNPSVAETVAALAAVVTVLAQQASVVLIIDDCQWAPGPLLDALTELADYLDHEPVLLLCVARPDLLDRRPDWGSGRLNATSMVLQGLTVEDALRLSSELVEVSAHEAGTCDRIIDRAEGNPLHLEQLFASLTADGSRWSAAPLPPTVYALLAARIDALGAPERLTLDLASVIGREFSAAGLQALAAAADPTGEGQCSPTLRELTRRRLIEPLRRRVGAAGPGLSYRFSSGLIQEVAYKGIAKRVRSSRHEQFARCLAAGQAPDAEVGGHLERAYRYRTELGMAEAGTDQLRSEAAGRLGRAGAGALANADLCWAEDLLGRAAGLLQPDEPAWLSVAQQLAEVQLAVGRRPDGLALMQQVLAAAQLRADSRISAHARLALATHDPAGGFGTAADAARAARPVFEQAGDELGLARAGIRIAQELQLRGRHGEAVPVLEDALERAVLAAAEPELAMALGAVGVSLWRGPTPAGAAIERCRQLLVEYGANRSTVRVTLNCPLAVLYALAGEPGPARECLDAAGTAARRLGYAEAEVFMPLFAATVAALAGEPDRAEAQLRQALRACDRLGQVGLLAAVSWDLARALIERGCWQDALALVAPVPAESAPAEPAAAPSEAADQLGVRARIEALRGNAELAGALADRACAEAARTDSPISAGAARLDRARVLHTLGRSVAARSAARAARQHFEQKAHLVGVGVADELIAALAPAGAGPANPEPTEPEPAEPEPTHPEPADLDTDPGLSPGGQR